MECFTVEHHFKTTSLSRPPHSQDHLTLKTTSLLNHPLATHAVYLVIAFYLSIKTTTLKNNTIFSTVFTRSRPSEARLT